MVARRSFLFTTPEAMNLVSSEDKFVDRVLKLVRELE